MLFIKSDELKLGMRLAKPIYNRDGVMLYERNSKLTRQGIVSIQNFGLIGVYILEPAEPLPPMSVEDIEFERFQTMSIFTIKEILDALSKQKEAKGMYQFANQVLKKYGSLNHRINFIQNLRSAEDYVYKHSLNTAILCALISHRMKMEFKYQLDVVVAAILHDMGSLLVPPLMRRKKKGDLTDEEKTKIRTYHYAAFQLIDGDYNMDPEVKRILRGMVQKFYNIGGSAEDASKIQSPGLDVLEVAYTFDNMTAMNFDEEPHSEIAALRYLLEPKNGFNQDAVGGLLESVNILNPGVCVELTDGTRGLVVEGNEGNVLAPLVLSFRDNMIYNIATSPEIQIKDIMRTMDNRHVLNPDMLKQYAGKTLHMGQKM